MSVNKKKSPKIQRYNESVDKLDDAWVKHLDEKHKESGGESSMRQELPMPLHSTPKKSSGKLTQEQSDLRASPMLLPCTQDGGNEVAWDWQSPLAKSTSGRRRKSNGEHVGTPKRTTMLQKKRNSNSPLLYKPIKRKLMKNDNQPECFETFTAEMKALSEQIKTKDEAENRHAELYDVRNPNVIQDELSIEIDIADFTESTTEIATSISYPALNAKKVDIPVAKTIMEDLFDDSIDESMVKCSQEVEAKLRLESCCSESSSKARSTGNEAVKDFSWHQQSYTSFLASKEKSSDTHESSSRVLDTEKTSEKMDVSASRLNNIEKAKATSTSRLPATAREAARKGLHSKRVNRDMEKTKSSINKTISLTSTSPNRALSKHHASISCTVATTATTTATTTVTTTMTQQSEIFEIPDDSFDEDFLDVCFDEVEKQSIEKTMNPSNQPSSRYGKFYMSPHANVPSEGGGAMRKYIGATAAVRKLLPPPQSATPQSSSTDPKRQDQVHQRTNCNGSYNGNTSVANSTTLHQSQSTTTINSSRKFFKTKSLSTSNFDDSVHIRGSTTSSSMAMQTIVVGTSGAKSWKSNLCEKSSSVSNSMVQVQQNITSTSAFPKNAWKSTNSERNNGIDNFNRNAPRDDGNRLKMINDSVQRHNGVRDSGTNNHSQSTQICTPEEIERKRCEAKMKLEMKRKLQARSKSATLLTDFTATRPPVKR